MARNIAVSDDVYAMLNKAKMEGESFSDVIKRLMERQKISDLPKVLEAGEWEKVEEAFGKQKELDLLRAKRLL
jgi:predicted CopG family antitoxin